MAGQQTAGACGATRSGWREKAGLSGRVWVLSELYRPERTSTGYFLTGIAEALARDWQTRVVCSQPTYSARGELAPWREVVNGVDIIRCRSTWFPKDRVLGRAANLLSFSSAAAHQTLRGVRAGDVVFAVTNPPTLPYAAAVAARARGARFVLLIHDVYPDVLVATRMAKEHSPLVRGLRMLATRLYSAADRIVVIGRDMRERIAERLPAAQQEKVAVITNWGDVAAVHPDAGARHAVRERLGLQQKFVVQLMGNLGLTHGLVTVLDAARMLSHQPDVHVQFVGWGSRAGWLKQMVAQERLENVSVQPPAPQNELRGWLTAADLSVIAFLPGMAGISVPSRLYNVLAAGRPVLGVCDDSSELARVLREEGAGIVVPPGNAEAVARAILEAMASPGALRQMGANARRAAEARYTPERIARAYRELFAGLGATPPAHGNGRSPRSGAAPSSLRSSS